MSASSTETIDAPTREEQKLSEPCERVHCHRESPVLVEVSVGRTEHQWCPDCVHQEFGLEPDEYDPQYRSKLDYVTPETVLAFSMGLALMLLVASVLVW
jgi:hypothetical protein